MAPKLWRQSYGAKGMHAFIDYHRFGIIYYAIIKCRAPVLMYEHGHDKYPFSTNYLYHAKFYINVKIHPLSLISIPLSASKKTTFSPFVLLALAYQCPHMNDPL